MIDTTESTHCLVCEKLITQKGGRGHRKRQYCDERCRQRGHRNKSEPAQESAAAWDQTLEYEVEQLREQLATLEYEVEQLREQLAFERRFRTDVTVRHFKHWLRSHDQARDTDFFRRFQADTRLPQHASRALYTARLKLYGYSAEDIALFQEAWMDMLLIVTNRDT